MNLYIISGGISASQRITSFSTPKAERLLSIYSLKTVMRLLFQSYIVDPMKCVTQAKQILIRIPGKIYALYFYNILEMKSVIIQKKHFIFRTVLSYWQFHSKKINFAFDRFDLVKLIFRRTLESCKSITFILRLIEKRVMGY